MYRKGARAERELCRILEDKGWAVIRVAGSGHGAGKFRAPDIVAAKNGKIIALECKFWNRNVILDKEELADLDEFCGKAGAFGYIANKIPYKGWRFIPITDALAANGNMRGLEGVGDL